jgi:prolyl-tRNA synthetase
MAITPRAEDFSARYNDVVQQVDLAESSAVKGCMVIKPYGYAIRENIRDILDAMFKKT